LIEIFVDGFFGVHRFFAAKLGGFYTLVISLIEILSVGAFIGTIIFLARRNLLKLPRFHSKEMKGWPFKDANIILFLEILLIIGIFSMNGADKVLQGLRPHHFHHTGAFAISSWFGPAAFGNLSEGTLMGLERFGWWLHILVVYAFLNYLPKSKHLHLLLAFPNTYYAKLTPPGQMENMPEIMNEVKMMMGLVEDSGELPPEDELPEFGANDISSLTWRDLLAAYTCTECGRCTSECPANETGKVLSPRKIMMDVRDRVEEVANNLASGNESFIAADKKSDAKKLTIDNYDDGKSLFDYISREEIHACTTCNACVEACPVTIDPLSIIIDLRRYLVMEESKVPSELAGMLTNIENNGAPWQFSPADRLNWATED